VISGQDGAMLNRRGFTATAVALLAGCGKPPQAPPEAAVSLARTPHLTDADIQAFLSIVQKLPGQNPPAFQPLAEVDFTSDAKAADMVSRWQREFRSSYNPVVQAKLWKRDTTLRVAFVDCGVEPENFATLLVSLATAVVRESLDPEIDLAALSQQADAAITSLCSQFDGLDRDPRLSPSVRNSRAELLSAVLKETVAYREFLRLLEQVPPESVAAIPPRREVLERLMPTTETVQLFRKKLQSQGAVIQASHESASRRSLRTK
jgi:hypothetical protein